MAVPTTGTITMLGLAQEVAYGTYGSGTLAHAIRMSDLINGGGQNFFPDIQTGCIPNPHTRNVLTLTNVFTNLGSPFTLYYNGSIGVANQLSVNDFLFTDSSLTTPASSADYDSDFFQNAGSASTVICSDEGEDDGATFDTDSTGKITSIVCSGIR